MAIEEEEVIDDQLTVLRTYLNRVEAEVAKTALTAAGIECLIRSDDCGGMRPHLWFGTGIELLVSVTDRYRAVEVLDAETTVVWDEGDDDETT